MILKNKEDRMKKLLLTAIMAVVLAAWVVPATASVDFGGQIWVKGEWRDHTNYIEDSPSNPVGLESNNTDDRTTSSYIKQRSRIWGVAKPTDDTTVKITIQDSRTWGDGLSKGGSGEGVLSGPKLTDAGSGNNHLDLHEAFIKIDNFFGTPLSMKIGRQKLVYGDQRLIGGFEWNVNARSFDALKLTYGSETVDIDFFASKIYDTATTATDTDPDQNFYGIYSTIKSIPDNTLDLYLLLLRDGSDTAAITANNTMASDIVGGGINGSQNIWTYGARLKGKFQDIDYTLEIPFQTGNIDTGTTNYDVDAYAIAAKVGYTLPTAQKIRVGIEYDFASGDSDSTDSDIETFTNLYPTNHLHYGYMDRLGWRNMEAWSVNVKAQANDQLTLYAAYFIFKLAEEKDGWYGAGAWMNGAGQSSTNTEDELGSELDFVATYKYNKAVKLQAGLSRFFTGDYIDNGDLGANAEDSDWGYLKIIANF